MTSRLALAIALGTIPACITQVPPDNPYDTETPASQQAKAELRAHVVAEAAIDPTSVQLQAAGRGALGSADALGDLDVKPLDPGAYALSITAPDHEEMALGTVTLGIGEVRDLGTLRLVAHHGRLSGRITLVGANTHAGTIVSLSPLDRLAVTSASGDFTVDGLPVGTYAATLWHDGFGTLAVPDLVVSKDETTTLVRELAAQSGDFSLNEGDPITSSVEVRLGLAGFPYPYVEVSESADFTGASWLSPSAMESQCSPPAVACNCFLSADVYCLELTGVDGLKTVYARFSEDGTTVATATLSASIILDTHEPVPGALVLDGGANIVAGHQFTNDPSGTVTLSLPAATDATTGIEEMRVSTDGTFDAELWKPYSDTSLVVVPPGDCTSLDCKSVCVHLRDRAGVETVTPTCAAITLDTTPPAAPIILTPAQVVNVTAGASFAVVTAGPVTELFLDHYEVMSQPSSDHFAPVAAEAQAAGTLRFMVPLREGPAAHAQGVAIGDEKVENTVRLRAVDQAGNAGPDALVIITEDSLPPDGPGLITPAHDHVNADTYVVYLEAAHAGANLDATFSHYELNQTVGTAALDDAKWTPTPMQDGLLFTLTAGREPGSACPAPCKNTLYVRAVDRAGSPGPQASIVLFEDSTVPSKPMVLPAVATVHARSVQLRLVGAASDNGAALDPLGANGFYELKGGQYLDFTVPQAVYGAGTLDPSTPGAFLDGAADPNAGKNELFTFLLAPDTTSELCVRGVDAAGNTGIESCAEITERTSLRLTYTGSSEAQPDIAGDYVLYLGFDPNVNGPKPILYLFDMRTGESVIAAKATSISGFSSYNLATDGKGLWITYGDGDDVFTRRLLRTDSTPAQLQASVRRNVPDRAASYPHTDGLDLVFVSSPTDCSRYPACDGPGCAAIDTGSCQTQQCSNALTQPACPATGCFWAAQNVCLDPLCNHGDQAGCLGAAGCHWTGFGCMRSCEVYLDQSSCDGDSGCGWSVIDGKCWARCGGQADSASCAAASCVWTTSGSCQPRCSAYPDATSCANAGGCTWSTQWNNCNFAGGCEAHLSAVTCDAVADCAWQASGNCQSQSDCPYGNQATCDAVAGCTWSPSGWCQSSCTSHVDQPSCAAATGCQWFTTRCESSCQRAYVDSDGATCAAADNCSLIEEGSCSPLCNGDSQTCGSDPDCFWDVDHCALKRCEDYQDVTTCTSNLCQWAGNRCQNSCQLLATSSACAAQAGCQWQVSTHCSPALTFLYRLPLACDGKAQGSCLGPECAWDASAGACHAAPSTTEVIPSDTCFSSGPQVAHATPSGPATVVWCAQDAAAMLTCQSIQDPASCTGACAWQSTWCTPRSFLKRHVTGVTPDVELVPDFSGRLAVSDKHIVWARTETTGSTMGYFALDGTQQTLLPLSGLSLDFSWSGAGFDTWGNQIVFSARKDLGSDLYLYTVGESAPERMTSAVLDDSLPALDGDRVAWVSESATPFSKEVFVRELAETKWVVVSPTTKILMGVIGGDTIAFADSGTIVTPTLQLSALTRDGSLVVVSDNVFFDLPGQGIGIILGGGGVAGSPCPTYVDQTSCEGGSCDWTGAACAPPRFIYWVTDGPSATHPIALVDLSKSLTPVQALRDDGSVANVSASIYVDQGGSGYHESLDHTAAMDLHGATLAWIDVGTDAATAQAIYWAQVSAGPSGATLATAQKATLGPPAAGRTRSSLAVADDILVWAEIFDQNQSMWIMSDWAVDVYCYNTADGTTGEILQNLDISFVGDSRVLLGGSATTGYFLVASAATSAQSNGNQQTLHELRWCALTCAQGVTTCAGDLIYAPPDTDQTNPSIDDQGRVVWQSFDPYTSYYNIELEDLRTGRRESIATSFDPSANRTTPCISGDKVVWTDGRFGVFDIFERTVK